jgi:hypothetical protein
MAITIKTIPVLKAKDAKAFDAKVAANKTKKETVNFTKEAAIANKILEKAKI